MDVVIDTSAVIAVILGEPERDALIDMTDGVQLMAPPSLHWEVGNALAAMFRRGRIDLTQANAALALYRNIIIRFVDVELENAVALAHQYNTYAYDAYMLACALRYSNPLLSLDARLNTAARAAGITVMEVAP